MLRYVDWKTSTWRVQRMIICDGFPVEFPVELTNISSGASSGNHNYSGSWKTTQSGVNGEFTEVTTNPNIFAKILSRRVTTSQLPVNYQLTTIDLRMAYHWLTKHPPTAYQSPKKRQLSLIYRSLLHGILSDFRNVILYIRIVSFPLEPRQKEVL